MDPRDPRYGGRTYLWYLCNCQKPLLVLFVILVSLLLGLLVFTSVGLVVCRGFQLREYEEFDLKEFDFSVLNITVDGDVIINFNGDNLTHLVMVYNLTDPTAFGDIRIHYDEVEGEINRNMKFEILPHVWSVCAEASIEVFVPQSITLIESLIIHTNGRVSLVGNQRINYLEIRTNNSPIEVIGEIDGDTIVARTSNHAIGFERLSAANIELFTSNRMVYGNYDVTHTFFAETENAPMDITINAENTNPNITLTNDNGPIDVIIAADNYNGNFDITAEYALVVIHKSGREEIYRSVSEDSRQAGRLNNGGSSNLNIKTRFDDATVTFV